MHDSIKEHLEDLANDRAGWVARRDAAEALGTIAKEAIASLEAHRDDSDRDVQTAVRKALKQVESGGRGGGEVLPNQPDYSFADLIAGLAYQNKRVVTPVDGGCKVELVIDAERRQTVFVTPYEDPDGADMIRIYTQCGPATDKAVAWALRKNAHLLDCAFAVIKDGDGEVLILINNIERIYATPPRVKGVVKEIARYGDYLEKKLSGEDKH